MTSASLSIGDFARATLMSVKTLRHYHQIGLLEPADVDPFTNYRRYTPDQIPTAQVIRRFRDLQMPLEQIRGVLSAPDTAARNAVIASHLDALQASLAETQTVVASLRDLLDGAPAGDSFPVAHRHVPETAAAAISETVDTASLGLWLPGALAELRATLAAQGVVTAGPPAGIFDDDLFALERGQATAFIPCLGELQPVGRVASTVIPAAELATTTFRGPVENLDLAYGALAAHVTRHELGVDGPIREYYTDAPGDSAWTTEIGWPIFSTSSSV